MRGQRSFMENSELSCVIVDWRRVLGDAARIMASIYIRIYGCDRNIVGINCLASNLRDIYIEDDTTLLGLLLL